MSARLLLACALPCKERRGRLDEPTNRCVSVAAKCLHVTHPHRVHGLLTTRKIECCRLPSPAITRHYHHHTTERKSWTLVYAWPQATAETVEKTKNPRRKTTSMRNFTRNHGADTVGYHLPKARQVRHCTTSKRGYTSHRRETPSHEFWESGNQSRQSLPDSTSKRYLHTLFTAPPVEHKKKALLHPPNPTYRHGRARGFPNHVPCRASSACGSNRYYAPRKVVRQQRKRRFNSENTETKPTSSLGNQSANTRPHTVCGARGCVSKKGCAPRIGWLHLTRGSVSSLLRGSVGGRATRGTVWDGYFVGKMFLVEGICREKTYCIHRGK